MPHLTHTSYPYPYFVPYSYSIPYSYFITHPSSYVTHTHHFTHTLCFTHPPYLLPDHTLLRLYALLCPSPDTLPQSFIIFPSVIPNIPSPTSVESYCDHAKWMKLFAVSNKTCFKLTMSLSASWLIWISMVTTVFLGRFTEEVWGMGWSCFYAHILVCVMKQGKKSCGVLCF